MIGADTSWILTSTALVLIMTLPGLALFYGGLVRSSNILSVLIQCFAIACLASILWLVAGYSIAFSGEGAYIGDLKKVFLRGVGTETTLGNLPENVFFMFQMTFAVITPALIVGAYVERIKFSAVLWISGLWLLLVYAPVTHWIWGGGWLAKIGVQDFAGGLVVHLNCGMAALVIAKMLGSRKGFPNDVKPPHSPVLVFVGAAMLWVGWFGFNGGSALAADGAAGMAITVTHISAATAALTWMTIEWMSHGKPTLVGIATGAIAGLATITPASGFVGPVGAIIIGVLAGLVCYKMCGIIKNKWKIDDALDVMAVHGIGGVLGILLTAPLGSLAFGGLGLSEKTIGEQFITQSIGVIAVGLWCLVATWLITLLVKKTIGLRVKEDEEIEGLDTSVHGEKGYN
ncbi:ammonium transporter [Alphaproteobacteria bacterium]|jgi:ammonium transporter, Amt family|nr:ammonium transporter [Alphaproteobacteria bacterium]